MAIIGALPVTLTNGTIADATQVMADFNYILSQVNANAAPVTGGSYLPLAGGTLTGGLTMAPAAGNIGLTLNTATPAARSLITQTAGLSRWSLATNAAAEGGSNAGSDFQINRFSDAGALIDVPLTISRATGAATFNQNVNLNGAAGTVRQLQAQTNSSLRWQLQLGDATAEGGSNAGSNAGLYSYADNGTFLGAAFSITRSTRVVSFAVAIVNGPSDRSLKENIAPLEDSLDKVLALQGVSFNFIATPEKREIGLIAQDVEPIVPEVIQEFRSGEDEPKMAIDYPRLVAVLIESIKELTARVASLEAKLQST